MFFIIDNVNNKETPTQVFFCGFCEDIFFTFGGNVKKLVIA